MKIMEELDWAVEKLFYYLVTEKFILIPKILEMANREYIRMIQRYRIVWYLYIILYNGLHFPLHIVEVPLYTIE